MMVHMNSINLITLDFNLIVTFVDCPLSAPFNRFSSIYSNFYSISPKILSHRSLIFETNSCCMHIRMQRENCVCWNKSVALAGFQTNQSTRLATFIHIIFSADDLVRCGCCRYVFVFPFFFVCTKKLSTMFVCGRVL